MQDTILSLRSNQNRKQISPNFFSKGMQQASWEFLPEISEILQFRKWYQVLTTGLSLSDKSHVNKNFLAGTAWMNLVSVSARLCLTKILPDYLMHISVDSFLSVISCKLFINFLKALLWEIDEEKKRTSSGFQNVCSTVFGLFDLFPVFSY